MNHVISTCDVTAELLYAPFSDILQIDLKYMQEAT